MVAMEPLLTVEAHRAKGGDDGSPSGSEGYAPARSVWHDAQTLLENSGANGAKTRIIVVGRVRISITSFSAVR